MKTSLRFTAGTVWAVVLGTACFGQHYPRINRISHTAGAARVTDPQLINLWGVSRSPGSASWLSGQTKGLGTVYNDLSGEQSRIVVIPHADPNYKTTPTGTPTGTIFNSSQTDFLLAPGKPAIFLFSTIDGTIAGWNPNVPVDQASTPASTHAVTVVKTNDGSSYTGLASAFIDGKPYLYAANFTKGRVDVYDGAFHLVRVSGEGLTGDWSDDHPYFSEDPFVDDRLPRSYVPFNVQAVGNNVVVTYATDQQLVSLLETDGRDLGFVDIYNSKGHLLLRLKPEGRLNAPLGVTLAPADFARLSDNLLTQTLGGLDCAAEAIERLFKKNRIVAHGIWIMRTASGLITDWAD